jgi:hypothetical protein
VGHTGRATVAWLILSLSIVGLGGCGGTTTPATPEPGPGRDVRVTAIVPDSGATLAVRVCPTATTRPLCTRDIVVTVAATYDQPIALASVFVEFYAADGRRCAAGSSASMPLSGGVERAFEVSPTYVSFPPNQGILCPLPVTTTKMVAILVDVTTAEFQRVVMREVPGTYTFQMAPD